MVIDPTAPVRSPLANRIQAAPYGTARRTTIIDIYLRPAAFHSDNAGKWHSESKRYPVSCGNCAIGITWRSCRADTLRRPAGGQSRLICDSRTLHDDARSAESLPLSIAGCWRAGCVVK